MMFSMQFIFISCHFFLVLIGAVYQKDTNGIRPLQERLLKGPKNMLKGHKIYAVVFQVVCECKYTIPLKYCDT